MPIEELRDIKWLQSLPLVLDIYFEDIIESVPAEGDGWSSSLMLINAGDVLDDIG